jgi:hypothetical protein
MNLTSLAPKLAFLKLNLMLVEEELDSRKVIKQGLHKMLPPPMK